MSCYVRLMRREDTAQVTEIDREAFPTMWPPPNYQRELENRLAHYLVACDESKTVTETEPKAERETGWSRLAFKVRNLFNHDRFFGNEIPPPGKEYVVGFTGMWVVVDEGHITNIAVRKLYQRQGIGELLLISLIDLATELNARFLALEVRASNVAAQSLYGKYGFSQVGVRRGYYTDNHEDALLMSTGDITAASFQTQLQQLKRAHAAKWGIPAYGIVR